MKVCAKFYVNKNLDIYHPLDIEIFQSGPVVDYEAHG